MGTEEAPFPAQDQRALVPATAYLLLAGGVMCFIVACTVAPATTAALATMGSALFIAASGFLGEAVLMRERTGEPLVPTPTPSIAPTRSKWSIRHWIGAQSQDTDDDLAPIVWRTEWSPVVIALVLSLVAATIAAAMWHTARAAVTSASGQQWLGCTLIAIAFLLLVLERIYARLDTTLFAAATQLEILLRVPLLASAALSVSSLIRSLGYQWPYLVDRALIVFIVLVAIEIMLRSVARFFLPVPPIAERRSPATSLIAELIRSRLPRTGAIGVAMQQQFGIDLSRSWALAFLLRVSLPVAIGLVVFGWLLTGLTSLAIDQRAVYERFGVPVAIEGPGLHVHLPWPFGVMRKVELGVVHEIPIVFTATNGSARETTPVDGTDPQNVDAEAIPPASADRLWDETHPFEASYLIASASNGKQSFQIVNIDLRVVYRTKLSDEGAMAAAYHVADPTALIRAGAGRMLVRHFSRYTLSDVLGENRASFASSFRTELQQRLDQLQTGTDIIAVIVEAIHPPPEAAPAYHNVQAAQIQAAALVSLSHGDAFLMLGHAQQMSTSTLDIAKADASEQVAQAQAAFTLFQGDHQAYLRGGQAFLAERWLSHLDKDLTRSPLLIIDHRLSGANAPTVDLRRFGKSDTPPPVIPEK
jgi:regulator of protease activity HflC (stomatin/prohibitin superfamily)